MKRKRYNGDEQDAFSRYWRPLYHWKRGQLKKIKRGASKRERRMAKRQIREEM